MEELFHSRELQHRHVPKKPCNPPRSALTNMVKVKIVDSFFNILLLNIYLKRSTEVFRFSLKQGG